MTGQDPGGWLALPLCPSAAYNLGAYVFWVRRAQRPEYRTAVTPFIVWRDACVTPEGRALRHRGVRAGWRFAGTGALAAVLGLALELLGRAGP